jgi:hypothetical protein
MFLLQTVYATEGYIHPGVCKFEGTDACMHEEEATKLSF